MTFELYDTASRNLIESFDHVPDLLGALREMDLTGVSLALRDEFCDTIWADPSRFAAAFT